MPQFDKTPYHQTPGFLIRRLHQIHVAIFLEECAAFNITPVQFSLLKALSAGTEMDQATIATRSAWTAQPPQEFFGACTGDGW